MCGNRVAVYILLPLVQFQQGWYLKYLEKLGGGWVKIIFILHTLSLKFLLIIVNTYIMAIDLVVI